jgi:hypothetical protein
MTVHHVVVDGSNLATEGRTLPSLQQLDDAVRAYMEEYKPETVTVVVDASFPNRIDESERASFEEAASAGELITPPAGVIGRGDAFLLQIADRAGAVVLSNDSFQEFHGQYGWLFDAGRLVGGKPVPHVGWVFMERSPVRGPLSRRSMSDAKKAAKKAAAASAPAPAPTKATKAAKGSTKAAKVTSPAAKGAAKVAKTSARAAKGAAKAPVAKTKSPAAKPPGAKKAALASAAAPAGGRKPRGGRKVEPYNEALPFIEFVAAHPIGSEVRGQVERFASHGAYVLADGARCYVALKSLADPPPRSVREVLSFDKAYTFVVQAFDTPRRGVDLAMPGVVFAAAGAPAVVGAAGDPVQPTEEERVAPARKKAAAKKAPARKKKAAAKKAPAKRKKAAAKRAPARKKKAAKKKAPAKRKKAAAKKAPAKRKKAAKKKAPAKRKKAAARKAPAKRKKAAAKKAPAKRRKKAAAKKAPAKRKKAPAKRKAAKKRAPARKATKKR